jgi:hypothetical protein
MEERQTPRELTDAETELVSGGVPSVHQQATSPGTFPGGNPAKQPGNSNDPGNSP